MIIHVKTRKMNDVMFHCLIDCSIFFVLLMNSDGNGSFDLLNFIVN